MRVFSRLVGAAVLLSAASCGSDPSEPETGGAIPTAIRAAIAGTTVNLTWEPVPDAVGYMVYMAEVGGVKRVNVTSLIGNMTHNHGNAEFEHPAGLDPSRKYYFVITALHPGNKESLESCEVTAKLATQEATTC